MDFALWAVAFALLVITIRISTLSHRGGLVEKSMTRIVSGFFCAIPCQVALVVWVLFKIEWYFALAAIVVIALFAGLWIKGTTWAGLYKIQLIINLAVIGLTVSIWYLYPPFRW